MATPSFGVVEEHLHLGSVAVVGHPTNGHESVADRQEGKVGAREVHLGSRGGDTEELILKRLKNMLRLLTWLFGLTQASIITRTLNISFSRMGKA